MATIKPSRNPFLGESANPTPTPPQVGAEPTPPRPSAPSTPSTPLPSTSLGSELYSRPVTIPPGVTNSPSRLSRWRFSFDWRKYGRLGVVLLLIVLIGAGAYLWWGSEPIESPAPDVERSLPLVTTPPATPQEFSPRESTATEEPLYASENFRVGEIVVGGEAQFFLEEGDASPLALSSIRGEAFTEKNKQEVKLVVTWKTNRLSQATIEYSKGVGQSAKSVAEQDYGFNHSVVISGLDPASTYLYSIVAEDRFGNVVRSDPYAVFTGARTVSLFDLIAGAIGDVFGWAVDK